MAFVIRGVVRDPVGSPVAQARAFFAGGPAAVPDVAALTDERGEFALSAPTPGRYEISCHAEGFAPAVTPVDVRREGETRAEIRLTLSR